jgi:AcrR family transcriptional regulator
MSWQRGGDEGALYFHFPSKTALAVAVVQEHRSRSRRLIGEVEQRQRPALEKV